MPFPELAFSLLNRPFCVRKCGSHAQCVVVFNLPLDLIEQWLVK